MIYHKSKDELEKLLHKSIPERILVIAESFRKGIDFKVIQDSTHWDKWFLEQIFGIVETENFIKLNGLPDDKHFLIGLKSMGFSDKRISQLASVSEPYIKKIRNKFDIFPSFKRVDTCSAEFLSETAYLYIVPMSSQQNTNVANHQTEKVIILGGGPNRIGQGIEFDYCCVHASYSLRNLGVETI